MDKLAKLWSVAIKILPYRNESGAPTTQINFSEVEHFDLSGFSAHKSSTLHSAYLPKASLPSFDPRKPFGTAQSSAAVPSEPRARWTRCLPSSGKRSLQSTTKTGDLELDEITVLGPPTKMAKMESRETPKCSFFSGEKDVEIVKIIDSKKAHSNRNQTKMSRFTRAIFKRHFSKRSTLTREEEKEDKRKYSDLLQSQISHVYPSIPREKPFESARPESGLVLGAMKSLKANRKRSENAPVIVDLDKEEEAASSNRIQVNRRRSVTPVTQATEKPRVYQQKCSVNPKFLNSKPGCDFLDRQKILQWKEDHFSSLKARQEQAKVMEKESELLRKLNLAVQKKKKLEEVENLSKQLYEYARVTECHPVEEEEEEIPPLPDLTKQMEREIDNALRGNSSEALAEAFSLKILRRDILTLKGLNWLNDEIINFYMNLLMDRGKQEKYPTVYSFNTFFYPKLISGGHSVLKRWTKKVDIFSYDFVLAPVHLGVHWCMAIIDMREKSVKYFDSMSGRNEQCLKALRQYLIDEMMDKKKEKFDLTDWEFICMKDIPQQKNGSDCGMFSCMFAEYSTRRAPITFTQSDMPYFRRKMIYEIIKVKLLC